MGALQRLCHRYNVLAIVPYVFIGSDIVGLTTTTMFLYFLGLALYMSCTIWCYLALVYEMFAALARSTLYGDAINPWIRKAITISCVLYACVMVMFGAVLYHQLDKSWCVVVAAVVAMIYGLGTYIVQVIVTFRFTAYLKLVERDAMDASVGMAKFKFSKARTKMYKLILLSLFISVILVFSALNFISEANEDVSFSARLTRLTTRKDGRVTANQFTTLLGCIFTSLWATYIGWIHPKRWPCCKSLTKVHSTGNTGSRTPKRFVPVHAHSKGLSTAQSNSDKH